MYIAFLIALENVIYFVYIANRDKRELLWLQLLLPF